jgi:hypothetical protein
MDRISLTTESRSHEDHSEGSDTSLSTFPFTLTFQSATICAICG